MKAMGWLRDLGRDEGGNTLAIMAAAFLPIAGMMGSGLDMSRAYMAKAKLQTACDSAALATRRHMSSGFITQASKDEGKKFFDFNFPAGTMQTAPVTLVIDANPTNLSEVRVTASTTVPTSVMKLFGRRTLAISTACNADQDYVNNDIMLVLDVTGSMYCAAGTGINCAFQATEQANSRMSRLKAATGNLYDALVGAAGVRIRYGIMPYSMTVNPNSTLNAAWLRPTSRYHKCKTAGSYACTTWDPDTADVAPTSGATCIEERSDIGGAAWPIRISAAVSQADIDTVPSTNAQKWPRYDPTITTGENNSAYGPTQYPSLVTFCPAPAVKLAVYSTKTAYQTQVNNALAKVGGYTNHELGIIWGMRYLSTTGLFASENPATWAVNGKQIRVDKHIIFLTDGTMTADDDNYSSYGIPARDSRLTGSSSDLAQRHRDRFANACTRARTTGGTTIWVIALDTGNDTASLKACASGDDHFFQTDGSNLATIFTLIGKGIGKLRITK